MKNNFFSLFSLHALMLLSTIHFLECQIGKPYLFGSDNDKIKGITVAAPPNPFENNPLQKVAAINADWICLVPYGFTRPSGNEVYFNMDNQWWGEKPEGIRESIIQARANNLKVMLKPQIYIPGSWIGDHELTTEADWQSWEATYREYIFTYLKIAEEQKVELFCIGTEAKKSVSLRPNYWKTLIEDARKIYSGKLIYSANWDGYEDFPLWEHLDYIGISAYFPMSDIKTPKVDDLIEAWQPTKQILSKFASKHKKQIVFTEYGYQSVDGCAGKAWIIEKERPNLAINQQAQANAIEAILSTFKEENWWHGSFLWKWFPNMQGHEGYPEKDYTPQGKIAEETLRSINPSI